MSNSTVDRFMMHVDVSSDGCWNWKLGLNNCGYGVWYYQGKKRKAHRISYILFIGPIPEGILVCHHCDNRRCVNPEHLFLGTAWDNIHDAIDKGRHTCVVRSPKFVPPPRYGGDNSHSKVSRQDVISIYKMRYSGIPQKSIANDYGISEKTVSAIWHKRNWKWLTDSIDS